MIFQLISYLIQLFRKALNLCMKQQCKFPFLTLFLTNHCLKHLCSFLVLLMGLFLILDYLLLIILISLKLNKARQLRRHMKYDKLNHERLELLLRPLLRMLLVECLFRLGSDELILQQVTKELQNPLL